MIPVVSKRRPLALSLARFTSFAALTTALSFASGSAAQAASVTWDGEASFAWSNPLNWSSDTLPTAILPGDDLIFSGPTAPRPATIELGADRIANSLSFTADGFRLGNIGPGSSLTISSGNISVASGARATLNAPLLGTSGLNKTGNGTLALQNVSAYTGTIAISGGSIVAVNNGAFGASANTITLDGGTLRFYNQTNSANPPNNFGSGHGRVSRFINIGAGGGTIDVPNQNIIAFDNVNAFTGTGTLTKTGIGEFQIVNSNNFAGNLVVAPSGGSMWVRASGKLTNVAGITVNTGGTFVIDNQNGVGLFASVNDNDRLADSIPVTLLGGTLSLTARNSTTAGQSAETVGKVTLGKGQSFINATRSGGNGADLTISNLVRESGNIVRFGGTNLGATGDNPRIFVSQLNNAATPTGAPAGTDPAGFLGGWALYNSGDFANNTGGANGIQSAAYTTLSAGNFGATTLGQVAGADVTIGTVGAPTSAEILSLKLADAATRQLLFSDSADTLYVVQGGVLSSDNNNVKNIGSTTTRGRITAGSATGGGLRELFLLQNQNTMTVNSVIIDNPNGGAGVSVTKGLDGAVVLTAANTYTGGTNVFRGTLQVNAAGGLGSGPVVVKGNARLQLQAAGTVTAAAGIEVKDQADVFLNGGGISWTQPGDIFTIRSGSTLIANQNSTSGVPNANQGMNSLTRVAGVPVNGGDVLLEPGAIVAHNTAFNGVNGSESNNSTIKNLGTNADLFFGFAATFNAGANQSVTLGTGTPWMGLSTDSRGSRAWQQGTITLNSDVTFQGGLVSGSITNLTLGGNAVAGSYSLANASSGPVRIFTSNNVILDEDTPVSIAPNISFVVQSQSTLFPNRINSFGSGSNIASSVVVQAAGTLDPGTPFAAVQPAGTAGPLNAPVVIEAGGRLLLNDGNGVGSGALITIQPEGIVEVANTSNALAGTADTGQFAFQPGSILRLNQDNIFRVSNALGTQSAATLQVFGGNRALTSQSNPFLTVAVGTPVIAPETVSLGAGGGITNDSSSRQLNAGRGNLQLFGTTDISATTGTTFSIQANLDLQPGATVSMGLQELNGNPKRGDVRFVAPNSNTGDATTTISISGGTRLLLGNVNTIPDASTVNITAGGQLLLDVTNQVEVVGRLTGPGEVRANQTGTQLVIKTASDQTLGPTFSNLGAQQPTLTKWGTGNLTINTPQTSTGDLRIEEGTLTLSGAGGQTAFGIIRPAKGAELVLNNSVTALENRLGGKNINGQGGTIRLVGGSTPVTETIGQLNSGSTAGSTSYINVESGSATTKLVVTTLERFENTGGRQTTWVLRGPGMAGLPGTYDTSSVYTPNAGNPTSGLFSATTPNFFSNAGFGQTAATVQSYIGTPLVPVRGDYLGDVNANGIGTGFVTQDSAATGFRLLAASEYQDFFHAGTASNNAVNVKLSAPTVAIGGDTRFSTLTLAPGGSLTLGATLPLNPTPSRLLLNAGGLLVLPGASATVTAPYIQTGGSGALSFHTQGDLTLNAIAFSDTSLVKTGNGTLNFAPGTAKVWRGTFTVDGGTVNLGTDNSFLVYRAQNGFNGPSVNLNGGTLNLNGNSQVLNALNSSNVLPGMGGTLHSTSPAAVAVQGGGTFSGSITGPISLEKLGNNTLLLTNANSYSGSTVVRGGTLQLRDSGTLSGTSSLELVGSTLQLDNGYLSNIQERVSPGVNVTSKSGTVALNGAAGKVASQTFGTFTLGLGLTTINNSAGGNGANEITYGNLVRATNSGTMVNFGQTFGFMGTAGNTTTAIRNIVTALNGQPVTLTNGMIGGWAIVNGDHFATYSSSTGISYLSNTTDGYATYGATDLSTATAASSAINFNDGTSRTIAAGAVVNSIRNVPSAAQTLTLSGALTITSGGLITNAAQTIAYNGGSITSGSEALYVWINQGTTNLNSVIVGANDLVKGGGAILGLTGANTYTGKTILNAGTLSIGVTGANGDTTVAVPNDLVINGGTATVTVARSIKETANVTLTGSGRLNMRDAASTVETLNSIRFEEGGGAAGTMNVDRANSQPTSTLNLAAATPIIANNTNPNTGVPYFGANVGILGFTNSGAQTLQVNSPINTNALGAIGLRIDAQIGAIPAAGLIKTGNGLLVLNPTNTGAVNFTGVTGGYNGNISSLVNVMDVQQGILRFDNANAGGTNTANFTIQNGAGLLYRNVTANGSVRLNAGSFLGAAEGNATIGTVTTTLANQTVLNAAGNTTVYVGDYFAQGTNAVTVLLNGRLTGSGNINVVGPQITSAGGVFRLSNPILSGTGSNEYTGTIKIGTNAILESLVALVAPATRQTGSALGVANIELNGGRLRLRDDFSDSADVSGLTATYGNNVTLLADSFLDANRQFNVTGTTTASNTIELGTLSVPSGTKTLTVDSGNSYGVTFGKLDGSGVLMKGGTGTLTITEYAAGFTGGLGVQGSQGMGTQFAQNLVLVPTENNLSTFVANGGYSLPSGKSFNIAGTLKVGNNAGTIANGFKGVTSGENKGAFHAQGATVVTAAVLENDGLVGTFNNEQTISAPIVRGAGTFTTVGQPLTLDGRLENGTSASKLKFTGDSTVNLTGAQHTASAIEVQSGVLRIAPTSGTATIQGNINVMAVPASTVATGANAAQAVAGIAGTLQFDAPTVAHSGNITNSGTVQVSSGIAVVTGTIAGTPMTYVPGLLEGRIPGTSLSTANNRPGNPGTFGIKLEPRMAQTNLLTNNPITGWSSNEMWVYTGEFYDADGKFSFAEAIDDLSLVSIDGVNRIANTANGTNQPTGTGPWSTITTTATTAGQQGTINLVSGANTGTPTMDFGMGPNNDGWHTFEVRVLNTAGGGGAGFFANFGLGLNADGTTAFDGPVYSRPIDPGDGSLFRTKVGGAGKIQVDAGGRLNVGGFNTISQVTLAVSPASLSPTLHVTASDSSANALVVSGVGAIANLNVAGGKSLTVGTLTVPDGTSLTLNAEDSGTLAVTGNHSIGATAKVFVEKGTLRLSGNGGVDGSEVQVFQDAILDLRGSLTGNVSVNAGGVLTGNGTVDGAVTLAAGGIAPGVGVGILSVDTFVADAGSNFDFQIGAGSMAGTTYDQLKVIGADFELGEAQLNLIPNGILTPNAVLTIVMNAGNDPDFGTFAGLSSGAFIVLAGGQQVQISYYDNPGTPTFETAGLDQTNVSLLVIIPEPGSAALLLGGLASVMGLRRRRRA